MLSYPLKNKQWLLDDAVKQCFRQRRRVGLGVSWLISDADGSWFIDMVHAKKPDLGMGPLAPRSSLGHEAIKRETWGTGHEA